MLALCLLIARQFNNAALVTISSVNILYRTLAEFYFRSPFSDSEHLAAKQSNDRAITIENIIITAIKTTISQNSCLPIIEYISYFMHTPGFIKNSWQVVLLKNRK